MNKLALISLLLLLLSSIVSWFTLEGQTSESEGYVKMEVNPSSLLWWTTHDQKSSLSRGYSIIDWMSRNGMLPASSRQKIGISKSFFLLSSIAHFGGLLMMLWGGIVSSKSRLQISTVLIFLGMLFFVLGIAVMDIPMNNEIVVNESTWVRWSPSAGIYIEFTAGLLSAIALLIIIITGPRRHPLYRIMRRR